MEMSLETRDLADRLVQSAGDRIRRELPEWLEQDGAAASPDLHLRLFTLAMEHLRDPSPELLLEGLRQAIADLGVPRDLSGLVPGQQTLWALIHRSMQEQVAGFDRPWNRVQGALAHVGDLLDGMAGRILELHGTGDLDGPPSHWETLLELGKARREMATLGRTMRSLLGTRDPERMFRILEDGILGSFHLRSLSISSVHHGEGYVEFIRVYPENAAIAESIGLRYEIDHPDIICDVARSGRLEVIDGWDPRFHYRTRNPDGTIRVRQAPRHERRGQTAFFVPILAEGRTLGVMGTGCDRDEKPLVFREVERMQPFLHQVGATLAFVSEMAQRERTEKAYRESEEKYRALVEDQGVGIGIVDAEERFLFTNPAAEEIFGVPTGGLEGRNLCEFLDEAQTELVRQQTAFRRSRGRSTYDVSIDRPDGQKRYLTVTGTPRFGPEGDYKGTYGVFYDITGRRRLEEQLRQAQKMEAVGRLAGGIAHDYNNLLQVILGHCELMLTRCPPDNPLRWEIQEIQRAGQRTALLTRQLLAFSRKQLLMPKVLNLNDVVARMGEMLRRLIGEDIVLVQQPKPDVGRVRADPTQVEQVILNLALNARDAMPNGGRLTLQVGEAVLDEAYVERHPGTLPGAYVTLAVTDTGFGIEPGKMPHLFEPFYTTKPVGQGTGLGLAMVHGIIHQSGGFIEVDSQPGSGSSFRLFLPRVEEAAHAPSPRDTPDLPPGGMETILVAEDDATVRVVLGNFLRHKGYTVLEGADGAEALEASSRHAGKIHLLLADVVMPGMSGRELADHLISLRPGLKVLYISGYPNDRTSLHGVLHTDATFLAKPFATEELSRKIRRVLDGLDADFS